MAGNAGATRQKPVPIRGPVGCTTSVPAWPKLLMAGNPIDGFTGGCENTGSLDRLPGDRAYPERRHRIRGPFANEEAALQLALDPYMLRHVPLGELPALVADLGYEYIELSPREDFIPFYKHPRANREAISEFKAALEGAHVHLASMLPLFRWSGPDEDERRAAVRYWKRSIEIAVELGCRVMNSEFNGRPEAPSRSEAQFWRSIEELLPIFEREGVQLRLEPHPDDFIEGGIAAVDMIRGINSPSVSYLHCAPHTFHMGDNMTKIMEYAGPLLTHVHVADSFDHHGSSGNRYIINPPGSPARIHQHLDIGQGEVDWDEFFGTLGRLRFDGLMTVCVLAWEERARESSIFMREEVERRTKSW